ncbi:hypothetical protein [Shewanella sp. SNU WT4]|nr:hypothetical protein [Shewanella sp. SNU WT4]
MAGTFISTAIVGIAIIGAAIGTVNDIPNGAVNGATNNNLRYLV